MEESRANPEAEQRFELASSSRSAGDTSRVLVIRFLRIEWVMEGVVKSGVLSRRRRDGCAAVLGIEKVPP
jgi:hypothetical protein